MRGKILLTECEEATVNTYAWKSQEGTTARRTVHAGWGNMYASALMQSPAYVQVIMKVRWAGNAWKVTVWAWTWLQRKNETSAKFKQTNLTTLTAVAKYQSTLEPRSDIKKIQFLWFTQNQMWATAAFNVSPESNLVISAAPLQLQLQLIIHHRMKLLHKMIYSH